MPIPEEFLSRFCQSANYWRHEPRDPNFKRDNADLVEMLCREKWHTGICQWCLEFYSSDQMVCEEVPLGYLKTILRIPDDVTPVICKNCHGSVTRSFDPRAQAGYVSNFLLRALGPGEMAEGA